MSISTRMTAIEEHIGNAYNELEDLGIDTTNVDKNINNIAGLLQDIYNDYPKVSASNVTEASIDNTKQARMELDLKGNTFQQTYTGKNLIYSAQTTEQRQKKFIFNKSKITTNVWFSVILSESIGNNNSVNIQYKDTDWRNISLGAMNFVANEKVVKAKTLTPEQVQAIKDSTDNVRVQIYCHDSSIDLRNITFTEAMLSTIDNSTYEPYVRWNT